MSKVGSNDICLVVILINFVLKKDENYYPQVLFNKCNCIAKENNVIRYIIDDLEFSSYSDEDNSDKED